MFKINISVDYSHIWIDHPLIFLFYINDRIIHLDNSGAEKCKIEKTLKLPEGSHSFKIKVQNKDTKNTQVDEKNNIIADSFLNINSISFDGFDIQHLVKNREDVSTFYIDDNTTQTLQKTLKYGKNGTLELNFSLPLYNWLLEKLF